MHLFFFSTVNTVRNKASYFADRLYKANKVCCLNTNILYSYKMYKIFLQNITAQGSYATNFTGIPSFHSQMEEILGLIDCIYIQFGYAENTRHIHVYS